MDEQLNSVNAEQENVVDSQLENEQKETVETVNADKEEVATSKQKEKPVQTQEENAKIAAARRTAEQKAKDDVIAEMYGETHGIKTYAEYQAAIARQREQEQLDEMVKKDVPEEVAKELLENRKFREEVKARDYDAQIEKQKVALKDRPFFVELEPDIDVLIKDSKSKGQLIDVEVAYKYLRGDKMEELLSKTKDDTTKRVVADIHDRAKRAGGISPDAGGADDVDISDINIDMAAAFGNDPKDIAKYVKKQTRR